MYATLTSLKTSLTTAALDLILPPRCPGCRVIVRQDRQFCPDCWNELAFITDPMCATCGLPFEVDAGPESVCGDCAGNVRPYDRARSALRYQGSAVPVLLGFKHGDRTHLARLMAEQMARALPPDGADLIVPVPLDRRRLAKRGYNQAGLLARALSRLADIALGIDALARVKPTQSTAGMSRAGRFRAAQGAFVAQRPLVDKPHIILVDDVMTTGATVESASRALRTGGAGRVSVMTYARALKSDV
ncbi:MAG: ComF family protein [Pacificimonas sp.]